MEDYVEQFAMDEMDEFSEHMETLSDEEYNSELQWLDSIAIAIQEGKNVVPNPARYYDFMM